jgi:hypothetical protein
MDRPTTSGRAAFSCCRRRCGTIENTGKDTLRAVAFFAAAMFTQDFDQVMLPAKSHILGTPNRAG